MSEAGEGRGLNQAAAAGDSAGSLLRHARQAQGLHIAALAAMIKVTPRKLEALESDRYDELPDATFTRALAQAVCRALKIDAGPVLSRLPSGGSASLEPVAGGLNAPLRPARVGRREAVSDGVSFSRPVLWAAGLLVAAALIYLLPANLLPTRWLERDSGASAPRPGEVASTPAAPVPAPVASAFTPQPAASAFMPAHEAASAPAAAASVPSVAAPAASAPVAAAAPMATPLAAPASAAAPAAGGLLAINTSGPSWIEVQDASGKMLLSRTVQAGETVQLDGAVPLRVKVGNAAVTRMNFRGQPVPMASKDNVVRVELK
jgi:cytoskeleton protein RodZ